MAPKHQRLLFVSVALVLVTCGTMLILNAFRSNLVFFFTPSELLEQEVDASRPIRIGGLVLEGSLKHEANAISFTITDLSHNIAAIYHGIPPALFREGQGVVAEGTFSQGVLHVTTLLAKHDENYMPPEVAEALKKSGKWKHMDAMP